VGTNVVLSLVRPCNTDKNGVDNNRFANKESLKEIHRILKPGATFGMIWNVDECKFFLTFLVFSPHS
jgi:hypothetical protein